VHFQTAGFRFHSTAVINNYMAPETFISRPYGTAQKSQVEGSLFLVTIFVKQHFIYSAYHLFYLYLSQIHIIFQRFDSSHFMCMFCQLSTHFQPLHVIDTMTASRTIRVQWQRVKNM